MCCTTSTTTHLQHGGGGEQCRYRVQVRGRAPVGGLALYPVPRAGGCGELPACALYPVPRGAAQLQQLTLDVGQLRLELPHL